MCSACRPGANVNNKLVEALATFFYLGKAPIAPGTIGTLGAIPVAIFLTRLGPTYLLLGTVAIGFGSVIVAQMYESMFGVHDSRAVVIDEVVGFLVAMVWLPLTWQTIAAGFFIFRILDIFKPFPISVIDRKVKGGTGVVLDDVAAGLVTNLILQLLHARTVWLG